MLKTRICQGFVETGEGELIVPEYTHYQAFFVTVKSHGAILSDINCYNKASLQDHYIYTNVGSTSNDPPFYLYPFHPSFTKIGYVIEPVIWPPDSLWTL